MSEHLADELLRALAALYLSQSRWLADIGDACHSGDAAFAACFRRWQEELTMVKLQLHRAENRLLHFVMAPQESRERREARALEVDGREIARLWRLRLEDWFTRIHLSTSYRRLESAVDLDQEATTGDIITDLVALAEVMEITAPHLVELARERDASLLEETAFYRVIGPWRRLGVPALHEVLRWLSETLGEQEDL
ncbi:MAG: hypothetical protein H0V44_13135 [Planctomycetes bacterium]|nr:hypothetical protein [Planctomycetota bacterium]